MKQPNIEPTAESIMSADSALVRVFREGAIAASVWRRISSQGKEYLEFSLSRAWKSEERGAGYSHNFFAGNEDALVTVIQDAADFIRRQPPGNDTDPQGMRPAPSANGPGTGSGPERAKQPPTTGASPKPQPSRLPQHVAARSAKRNRQAAKATSRAACG